VEAKFRRGFYRQDPTIECCTPDQLQRYKEADREKPLFMCLGLGSNPSKSKELFIISMGKINATALYNPGELTLLY
jgi:hypothetical protein